MELKIRYDEAFVTVDVPMDDLYICVGLEADPSADVKAEEERLQEAFDEQFNRPEYNCLHQFDRHRGYSKAHLAGNDENFNNPEPVMSEVVDKDLFWKAELDKQEQLDYESVCMWIRAALLKKPKWAEAFIAVRLDGMSVGDYAASIGLKDASIVSKWLGRAEKKLREMYPKRQK